MTPAQKRGRAVMNALRVQEWTDDDFAEGVAMLGTAAARELHRLARKHACRCNTAARVVDLMDAPAVPAWLARAFDTVIELEDRA
jgi:hypothetical protein